MLLLLLFLGYQNCHTLKGLFRVSNGFNWYVSDQSIITPLSEHYNIINMNVLYQYVKDFFSQDEIFLMNGSYTFGDINPIYKIKTV